MPPRSIDAAAAAVLKCSLELHKWPLLFLPTRSEFQIGILRTYRDSARTAQHCLAGFSPIPLFIQTSPSTQTDRLPVQASEAPNCIERFKDFGLKFAFASASLKNIIRAASLNEESSPKIKSEKLGVFFVLYQRQEGVIRALRRPPELHWVGVRVRGEVAVHFAARLVPGVPPKMPPTNKVF